MLFYVEQFFKSVDFIYVPIIFKSEVKGPF